MRLFDLGVLPGHNLLHGRRETVIERLFEFFHRGIFASLALSQNGMVFALGDSERVIISQTYFVSRANAAKHISQALCFSLRSNQKINRALRAAYRKFDRTPETERLLRKHLPT